ncbi:uncharacterized protein V1518DRAFT_427805 [Limtongia smithiae]|uniref:uncharacterized protein n=1 Tax=Limtongia smithiae TaxID=1125753 RepID=UPI0034CE0764
MRAFAYLPVAALLAATAAAAASRPDALPGARPLLLRARALDRRDDASSFASAPVPRLDSSEGSPLERGSGSDADATPEEMERAIVAMSPAIANAFGTSADTIMAAYRSFAMSFMMIIFSEIGDKTFLIAAIMAMKNSRMTVFSAAFISLAVMTVLSALLGHAVPQLIPKKYTSYIAAVLFVVFGAKLLNEGLHMDKDAGVEDEMHEVEEELKAGDFEKRSSALEEGVAGVPSEKRVRKWDGLFNLFALFLSPIWIQTFVMTFLGEWGDRSQIATIAMAAGQDYWFVIVGAIVGHGLCTLAAVLGGKLLASKISLRTITVSGGVAFLVFAVIYFYEGIHL